MSQAPRRRFILRVTLGYVVFATAWIFLSDSLLAAFTDITRIAWLSTLKGIVFVAVTATLLYFVLHAAPDRADGASAIPLVEAMAGGDHPARWPRWLVYVFAVGLTLANGEHEQDQQRPIAERYRAWRRRTPRRHRAGDAGRVPGRRREKTYCVPPTVSPSIRRVG